MTPVRRGTAAAFAAWLLGVAFAPTSPAHAAADTAALTGIGPWVIVGLAAAVVVTILFMWRRFARAAGERDALAEALRGARGLSLVTGPGGAAVAASAGWRDHAGYDSATPLGHLAGGALVAEDGEIDRLRREAAAGDDAATLLRPTGRGAGRRWLRAQPLGARAGYIVWSLDDGPVLTESTDLARDTEDDTIGVYSVDQDGRFLYADATFAGWLGLDPADVAVAGTTLRDVLADDARAGDGGAVEPNDAPTGRLTFKRADGSTFDARFAQTIVRNRDGAGFHTRTLVRDVAALGARRDAADRAEAGFRRLFDDAPVGIAMLDDSGRVVDANPTFERLLGAEAGASGGRRLASLFADDRRADLEQWLAALDAGDGRLAPCEAQPVAGGAALPLFAARFGDRPGDRIIVYVLAPSESRNVDAQLLQSQKMELVGQLAGGIAHDFNNLLTAMIGFSDLLLLRHNPKDPSFSDITQIKQNANRAASLVRQLLAFSRQQTLQPRMLNLTDVLDELKHLLRRLMGANIELDIVHGRDIGLVKADQGQLEQVVINLAVNARDAMPDGGALTIRTGCLMRDDPAMSRRPELGAGDYVTIEVADTGCGIPAELLEKIYEPFFTTKEVGQGTGLGLATVYGIIKQTGGYIFVDSEPGAGTSFTIYLPRHIRDAEEIADDKADATEAARPRDLTGTGTVLLVEDEGPVRQFGARALRNKGYHVIEAENGETALGLLQENSDAIDLLITDVMMPGIDGPALIRKVRETHADLKVIFISGYTEDSFRQRLDDGAEVHFLPKPFSLQELAGKVKEVMSGDPA